MVLRDGWLNRQVDQVSKNVDSWPAWMKRAAGFEESAVDAKDTSKAQPRETPTSRENGQAKLNLE